MQDRFKFRAKLKNINKWIYGAYLKMLPYQPNPVGKRKPLEEEYKHLIIVEESADWGMPRGISAYEVIPETVGQCIGLKDKNGKLIYEGDIVKTSRGIANVEYDNTYAYFGLTNFLTVFSFDNFINEEIEVIGNIYENKDLLNE